MSEPATPPTILCIEDDRIQTRLLQEMVRAFRYDAFAFEHAATFDEGLTKLVSGRYAVCLVDYRLGREDGLEIIREARRARAETPVIVITADDTEEVNIAALEAGAVDFLVKSELTARLLERAVRYALKLGATVQQLGQLALRDELTGLLNRRELYSLLNDEWLRGSRFLRPFSVALADIDHFKRVNDEYGHPAGDKVIRHVADVLSSRLRRVDRVARFGGEEFAILMPETGRREAAIAMERMRSIVEQTPCVVDGTGLAIAVTISVGVALSVEDGDTPDALIAAADKALYAAKNGGRNRVCARV